MKRKKIHCQNCGAPITTEICFYCKSRTGIDSKDADMPYEVIEIFEAEKTSGNYLITIPFLILSALSKYFASPIALIWNGDATLTSLICIVGPTHLIAVVDIILCPLTLIASAPAALNSFTIAIS